jgi:hypothetical protein
MNSNKAKFNSITKQSLASGWLSCQGNIRQFLQHATFFFFFWTCLHKGRGKMIQTSDFYFIKHDP